MRALSAALLLVPSLAVPALALPLVACAEEGDLHASSPTEAAGASGLPPPLYVTMSTGACDDADATGCEARCAAGNDDACARTRAGYAAAAAEASAAPVQVDTPRAAVQFFGPVGTVNVAPASSR